MHVFRLVGGICLFSQLLPRTGFMVTGVKNVVMFIVGLADVDAGPCRSEGEIIFLYYFGYI